jgi:hypothetical protein
MKNIFYSKTVIIFSIFLFSLIIFKSLQNKYIFDHTLGKIAITYERLTESLTHQKDIDITKSKKPYTTLDEENFIHWDVIFFKYMKENSYGKEDSWPGIGTYAFSPLFPFIWKLTHLPARYMTILNYLFFAFSILILSTLFLSPTDFSKFDQLCLFAFALTLPSVFSFYIPYCESVFIFTMSLALWGLFKDKYWLFFVALIAFALTRPSFLIFGVAIICTDVYFLLMNKNFRMFSKELAMKLLPVVIGMLITFFIQYLSSGDFFKMFEVHERYWNHKFQVPVTITDWSTEGYGMNIFSIFSIAFPSFLFILTYFLKNHEVTKVPPISLFSIETRRQYLFTLSIVYFIGNFIFVYLTQGGNLNGLHRYILVSPFFYIFFFIFIKEIREINLSYLFIILTPMVFAGYWMLGNGPYQHEITFSDMGYFLLVLSMLYFILFNRMKQAFKFIFLFLLIPINTVWLTYLFNHFLNNAFIIP